MDLDREKENTILRETELAKLKSSQRLIFIMRNLEAWAPHRLLKLIQDLGPEGLGLIARADADKQAKIIGTFENPDTASEKILTILKKTPK